MDNILANEINQLGIRLTELQVQQFQLYAKTLCQWNQKTNLTRIISENDIAIKHFFDSMAVIKAIPDFYRGDLLDIGSGAGFPGIPLSLILPDASFTLLDASRKRVSFLKYIINILGLKHVNAYHGRMEQWRCQKKYINHYNVVVSRAFSEIKAFVDGVIPLVKDKGRIIAMKGINVHDELKTFTVPENLNMVIENYTLPMINQKRYLVCFDINNSTNQKTIHTDSSYNLAS